MADVRVPGIEDLKLITHVITSQVHTRPRHINVKDRHCVYCGVVQTGAYQAPITHGLVMQRYIVQTIYRVDIGHIVSYRYRQEKYRNFDIHRISLSFRNRFNID